MKFREWNRKALLLVGLIAGIVQAVFGIAMYVAGVYFSSWSMLVTVVVLVLCIVIGTRWYTAKYLNNEISYSQAVIVGIVISVCTGLVYAIYNIVSVSFFYPRFLDDLATLRMELDHQSTQSFESVRSRLSVPAIALSNLVRLSIVGSLFSLLTSLFLKRRGSHV